MALEETLISGLVGAILGSIIGFLGTYLIYRRQQKETALQRHSEKLKTEVLDSWLEMLKEESSTGRFNSMVGKDPAFAYPQYRFESVNKRLFDDLLINHLPKIRNLKKSQDELEMEIEQKQKILAENYSKKYPKLK